MLGAGKGCHSPSASTHRNAATRNRSTAARCWLLARVLVAITLAVPCIAAAQDEVPADAIGQLLSSFDELLQRDGLTPQQVAW